MVKVNVHKGLQSLFAYDEKTRRFLPPDGILDATYEQAHEAGCLQAEEMSEDFKKRYYLLHAATGLNLCSGCPVWETKGPQCACFQRYHTAAKSKLAQINRKKAARVVRSRPRCAECGLRIRGLFHADGEQHKQHAKRRLAEKLR